VILPILRTISAIRFYKGSSGNSGTHTALLYNSAGQLLAQAPFNGETASGWQTVNLPSPVSIAANTTYIAAYHTTSGYATSLGFFSASGTDSAPLHALRSGVEGGNGVYHYGPSPAFPTDTWGDANYWLDVLFTRSQ